MPKSFLPFFTAFVSRSSFPCFQAKTFIRGCVCMCVCVNVVQCVTACSAVRTWRVRMSRSRAQLVQLLVTHIEPCIEQRIERGKQRNLSDNGQEIRVPYEHDKELNKSDHRGNGKTPTFKHFLSRNTFNQSRLNCVVLCDRFRVSTQA